MDERTSRTDTVLVSPSDGRAIGRPEIHITDMMTFLQCRRRWDWSSLMRRGLQRGAIAPPLFLGQGVHIGLQAFYSNDKDVRAALLAFRRWVKDRTKLIREYTGPLWDYEKESITEIYELGSRMLDHYALWSRQVDDVFLVDQTEYKFKMPILDPSGNDSGMDFAGRFDGIMIDARNQKRYVLEFKTTGNMGNPGWIFLSPQGSAYAYAAGRLFGRIEGVMYRLLRKKVPAGPLRLKRGGFSQAKSQDTTYVWFRYCLDSLADQTKDPVGARRQLYRENARILNHLRHNENKFFLQQLVHKRPSQLVNVTDMLYGVGLMMADPDVPIFAQPDWFKCNPKYCPFRDPCDLLEYGGDYESLLEAEYGPRTYWEDNVDEND